MPIREMVPSRNSGLLNDNGCNCNCRNLTRKQFPLNPDVLSRCTVSRFWTPRSSRPAGFHTFRHSAATIVNQKTGNLKLEQNQLHGLEPRCCSMFQTVEQLGTDRQKTAFKVAELALRKILSE